jgi:trans-aconitate methyltransferase
VNDRIAAYYDELAAKYGNAPQAVDAPNQVALDVRYQALGDLCDMNGKRVLEVGCGHGGLGAYLTDRYPEIDYRGIDISEGLLSLGRQAHPDLRLYHRDLSDLSDSYDVVLAQGIFYLLDGISHASELVRRMLALADEAVAFTAVSAWKPNRQPGELHVDPIAMLQFCHALSSRVALRHDYLDGDVAFYLYR